MLERLEVRELLSVAPVPTPDVYAVPANTSIDRSAPGWLANDTDADGDVLSIAVASSPAHGTLTWEADGQWSYRPQADFVGVDRFEYQVHDGTHLSSPTEVQLRVGRYADRILADGPLAYWPLDELTEMSSARDRSGNEFHGSYQGVVTGRAGAILAEPTTAARFGADNGSIYLGGPAELLNLRNELTIEAWVNPVSLSSLGRIFANSQHDSDRGIGFGVYEDRLIFTTFGIQDYITRPVFAKANQWYHVVVVVDDDNDASFYVDGQLVDQIAGSVPARTGQHAALLGSKSGSDESLRGHLDEVAIYDHLLTAEQIAEHFLLGRIHAGRGPRSVDDHYRVAADGSLTADVTRQESPRHSFADDFAGETLNSNLRDPTRSFVVEEGRIRTLQNRQYLRTVKSDYMQGDFLFEVDVHLTTTEPTIEFIGIGSGEREPSYDEPADALYVRFHSVGFAGTVALSAAGPFGGFGIGEVNEPGVHRVRLVKSGNQLTVFIDEHFDGLFHADFAHTVEDVSGFAPFLDNTNSHLILGGSTLSSFDNLRIESSLDPPVVAGVLANDIDPDTNTLIAHLVSPPQSGTLQLEADGTFRYTPAPGFAGTDQFVYRADDGTNFGEPATVRIDVLSPIPRARDDQYAVAEDATLRIESVAAGLLHNDGDLNELPLRAELVTGPVHGELTLQDNGTFTYVPHPDFFGTDTITYRATNGTLTSSPATVTIHVEAVNDVPIAVDDAYVLDATGLAAVSATQGIVSNDRDVEGQSLTATLLESPRFGSLILRPDGSFRYTASEAFVVRDQFTYVASDGLDVSAPATVVITADAPTIWVPSTTLLANTPNQQLALMVTGGHAVSGMDLFVQIGDGGPELVDLGLPAGQAGPRITGVDLKTGTIFHEIADSPTNLGSIPQVANWTISLSGGGEVDAAGVVAILTIDTTGLFGGQWDVRLSQVLPQHPLGPFHTSFSRGPALVVDGQVTIVPAEVKGRYLFYNDSSWDQNNPLANAADDASIAIDKQALRPGEMAGFANYSSYSSGINGIMIDVAGVPDVESLTPDDFGFRVGRSNDPSAWTAAPRPQMSVRRGAGIDGSDRLSFVWPNHAIESQWLEVTVPAGSRTYLADNDVFFFGNAIGETGNAVGSTLVTSIDVIAARDHQRGPFSLAPITDVYDFNRDRIVSSIDVILARDHQVGPLTALPLITPSADWQGAAPRSPLAATPTALPGDANRDGIFDSKDLIELFQRGEYEDAIARNSTWSSGDWNGDGEFDSRDLVLALQLGLYQTETPRLATRQ